VSRGAPQGERDGVGRGDASAVAEAFRGELDRRLGGQTRGKDQAVARLTRRREFDRDRQQLSPRVRLGRAAQSTRRGGGDRNGDGAGLALGVSMRNLRGAPRRVDGCW
jgi:hypothetical protein